MNAPEPTAALVLFLAAFAALLASALKSKEPRHVGFFHLGAALLVAGWLASNGVGWLVLLMVAVIVAVLVLLAARGKAA